MLFWYVVAIILGFDVLVCLILAIPVDAELDLDVHGEPVLKAEVKWLFGLVTLQPGGDKTAVKKAGRREYKNRPKRQTGFAGLWERLGSAWELLQTKGLLNEVKKLIVRLVGSFKIKEMEGVFRAGLPDPAYTGMLYGLFMAATMPFDWPLMRNVRLYPVFDGFVFEGDLHAVIRVRPINLLTPPVLFIFSLPILTVVKTLVVTEWRIKKSRRSERYPSAA